MCGAGADEAPGFCFDYGAEGIVSQCVLLLEVVADFSKRGFVEGFVARASGPPGSCTGTTTSTATARYASSPLRSVDLPLFAVPVITGKARG